MMSLIQMKMRLIGEHTDVFAYIGLLSGFMRRVGPGMDLEKSFEIIHMVQISLA